MNYLTKKESTPQLNRIKKLKKDLGLVSTSALAQFTGMSRSTMNDWLTGKARLSAESIDKFDVRLRDRLAELDVQSEAIRAYFQSAPKSEMTLPSLCS